MNASAPRLLRGCGLLLVALVLACSSAQRVGEAAPDFRLVDGDGRVVSLADLRGTPVVLNFWATWCPPCLEELPLFQEVSDALNPPASDPAVVFLLLNYNESPEVARAFLTAEGIALRALLEPTEAQRAGAQRAEAQRAGGGLNRTFHVLRDYRVRGLPTTVFIDEGGVVRGVRQGLLSPGDLSALLATIGVAWGP